MLGLKYKKVRFYKICFMLKPDGRRNRLRTPEPFETGKRRSHALV